MGRHREGLPFWKSPMTMVSMAVILLLTEALNWKGLFQQLLVMFLVAGILPRICNSFYCTPRGAGKYYVAESTSKPPFYCHRSTW
ncbi:hypothetical protein V8C40DRAFT_241747 [Trichoderma camerunense]